MEYMNGQKQRKVLNGSKQNMNHHLLKASIYCIVEENGMKVYQKQLYEYPLRNESHVDKDFVE